MSIATAELDLDRLLKLRVVVVRFGEMDNCVKRALIPIESKRNFLDVSADVMGHVEPKTVAMKVLGG